VGTTLVLGVGNTLLSDEGAGIRALNILQDRHPALPNVQFLDGGTLSFTLAGALQEADSLIVFDAAKLNGEPGTARCMVNEQMDDFLGSSKPSAHEVGLLDLLDIARLMESLPERRALIGIQPKIIDWGVELSEPVQRGVVQAANQAERLLQEWADEILPQPLDGGS